MKNPKRILVVVSGKHTEHPALERALKFAEFNDVHIHLFNSIYEPVMELTDVLSSEHRKEMKRQYMADRYLYMDTLADSLDSKGISCSVNVAWHRELHEAIEQVVDELEPDLVIKRISADIGSINPFTMPIDRHLIRYCKAPLLLVREAQWQHTPILAAVDPTSEDAKHVILNQNIIEYGKMLAHTIEVPLQCVNSYASPPVISPVIMGWPEIDYKEIKENISNSHRQQMQNFLRTYDMLESPYHVVEGRPEIAIPMLAKETHAQLILIGTTGRSGVSGALIGNTAERILANLNCEILTLKYHQ